MCDSSSNLFHGCHGLCVKRPLHFDIFQDFFELHQCNNEVGEYPGMCFQHSLSFHLAEDWEQMPSDIQSVVYYISNPTKYPLIFFELFIMSKYIPWKMVVKILLEPLCFWIITEEHFALTILFGARFLECRSENTNQQTEYSYAYVLDSVCQILGWIMNGEEDLTSLKITKDEMIAIKWLKITKLVIFGFLLCFGANGMPRQLPNFQMEWKDIWNTRFKYWIDLYIFNGILDSSQVEQTYKYFTEFLEHISVCASFAVYNPESDNDTSNLQERILEFETLISNKAIL